MINRLKYWWYRRANDYPCKEEVAELVAKTKLKSLRILGICANYCKSDSIEETAIDFGVTRERVRQILWKVYRSVHNVESNVRPPQEVQSLQDLDD